MDPTLSARLIKLSQYTELLCLLANHVAGKKQLEVKEEFLNLFAALYIEKIFAHLAKYIAKVTEADNDLFPIKYEFTHEIIPFATMIRSFIQPHGGYRISNLHYNAINIQHEIESNYSSITRLFTESLFEVPTKLARFIPAPVKSALQPLIDQFSLTPVEYAAKALKEGRVSNNVHMSFNSLTDDEVKLFIDALENGKAPIGLTINYDASLVDKNLNDQLQSLIVKNNVKHAALACATFQQGKRDENSIVSLLPQETLNRIYKYTYPSAAPKAQWKNYINNVSIDNRSCFFQKHNSHKQSRSLDNFIIPEYSPTPSFKN